MNRSTQPLPSGCLTKDGLDSMPGVLSSSRKACEMNWLSWSWRSFAQTLRWPSPTKSVDASTERISARICSTEREVFGPRFAGILGAPSASAFWRWTVARASFHALQTRWMRRACLRRVTSLGSKRRPPRRRAESVLEDLDLLLEELNLHGLVADLGLEVVDEAVAVVGLARLEPRLNAGERLVTPPCFKFGRACRA
jgi:hypothetical protein